MLAWLSSFPFAVLVAAVPFTFVLKLLLRMPRPIAPSHRRWPLPLNIAVIVAVTTYVTVFIRGAYDGKYHAPLAMFADFLIAALVYAFGLVLLLRQFSGAYSEFIVTTNRIGLGLRKTTYRNIRNVETLAEAGGETSLRIDTVNRGSFLFSLPTRYVSIFHDQIRKKNEEG